MRSAHPPYGTATHSFRLFYDLCLSSGDLFWSDHLQIRLFLLPFSSREPNTVIHKPRGFLHAEIRCTS